MKKNFKFMWLGLVLCLLLFSFISCKGSDDEPKYNEPIVVDEDVIYSPYVDTTLVIGEGVDESDLAALKIAYYKQVGKEIAVSSVSSGSSHEIIIGKTDADISKKAYRSIELMCADGEVGYTIYSDGRSVAIAFDEAAFGENIAFTEAIECFVANYMQERSLKLDAGAVCYDTFDPIERQEECDEASDESMWSFKLTQLTAMLDGDEETAAEVVRQLQGLQYIFNDDYSIVKWLANLYDPVTGGFYYSNSARNNEGYLPDLESTSKAIGLIELILSGYGGTLTDYFGEEIAANFVSFVNNMQDENGYFYHPQWSRELTDKNDEKKDRDVLNALNILGCFGASPIYDTPNGVNGTGAVEAVSSLVTPLRESSASAVSAVVSVSSNEEVYIPSHLKSQTAFESYLSSLGIRSNTAEACKTIYSELSLYKAVDEILAERGESYRICTLLYNYLAGYQNYATGLWCTDKTITYEEVAELSEVVKIFNAIGFPITNYESVLETLKSVAEFSEDVDDISEIAGVWMAFAAVVNNILTYSPDYYENDVNNCLKWVYSDFGTMLESTRIQLLRFIRDDGSFSTTTEGSAYESYGMSIAVPASVEGDIDATILATKNVWLSVFSVLNMGQVPIFTTSDRMMFQKTLLDMGVIIKNKINKTEAVDFEDQELDKTDVISATLSSYSYAKIVNVPEGTGKALQLYSPKAKGSTTDYYYFDVASHVNSPSCFTYELDICVLPETTSALFAQIFILHDVQMIALTRKGDTIRLTEKTGRGINDGYTHDLGVSAAVGEWFNLKVEYYLGTESSVRVKVYFNGECVTVSDNYFGKHSSKYVPATEYTRMGIYAYQNQTTSMLVDNIITESTYKTYTQETSTSLNRNIDTPDKSQTMYDFESDVVGSTPLDLTVGGEKSAVTVTTDSDNNNLLAVSEKAGEIILPLDQRGSGVNSATVEFDFTVDSDSEAGAKYQISFNEYFYSERTFAAIQILVLEENGTKYVTLADVVSGSTGTPYSDIKLSLDVKYRLTLRLFFDECVMIVYIDGDIVGVSSNVLSTCKGNYMGETTFTSATSSVKSTIYIDNLVSERIKADFAEMTTPTVDRVIHTFDTSDGLELSAGLSPSGDVLSFADAIGESYVKIPVNERAFAPTMALVGLDVIRNSASTANITNMTIYLTDKSDNIIAAFELVTGSSGVSIYERTANGVYPAPMHTVDAASTTFTLQIEYSPAQASFNILVNGEYVAATSLIYASGSTAYDFDYLRISTNGSSDFAIDNLYAEEICDIFSAHSVTMVNTDNTGSVITYETSSFASMPSKSRIERILGNSSAYHRISESIVYDKVSKVLEMNLGAAEGTSYSIFYKTETVANTNAAYFETDIKLSSVNGLVKISFELQSGSSGYAYALELRTSGVGEPIIALAGKKAADYTTELSVTEGEWFKLRIEYRDTVHDFNYDGLKDIIARVYINGELIGEGYTANNLNNIYEASAITRVRMYNVDKRQGIIYFDNTALGQCNLSYTPPVAADTDTITYSPGVITDKTTFNLGSSTSTAKISDLTDTEGNVNKVLDFYTAADSLDNLTVIPTLTSETANAVMFETDIMIDPLSDSATFYLEPQNSAGKQPFRLILTAEKDGTVRISSSDISKTVIGNSGEWIHIRVEYMNPMLDYTGDRKIDILYKVYVGEGEEAELVATGYQLYTAGAYYDPLEIEKFVFTATSESEANILIDNTRFWQVEREADEAPEFTETDDYYYYGGSVSDYGGWT